MSFSNTNAGITAGPRYADALHLKLFSGETMTAYRNAVVMRPLIRTRTISNGSSYQFPAIGNTISAAYHTPGQVILGQQVDNGERIIYVDDLLVADTFISNWEEAINHFEVRSEYTSQMGNVMAQIEDKTLFAIAARACRLQEVGPAAGFAAASIDKIGATPTLQQFVDALYDAAAEFDKRNIPREGRVAITTPDIYWDLIQDGHFLRREYGNDNGNQQTPGLVTVAGWSLRTSQNMNLDFSNTAVLPARKRNGATVSGYNTNNTTAMAQLLHPSALGGVYMLGMATESEYQISRQGWLTVTKMAAGYGVLREEALHLIAAEV